MAARRLRILIGIAIGLLIAWYFLPLIVPVHEPRMQALLGMAGYDAILPSELIYALSFALIVAQLVGLIGLWMLKSWGRWFLLAGVVGTVVSSPFVGVAVESPLGVFVGFLSTLLEGALVAIAFGASKLSEH